MDEQTSEQVSQQHFTQDFASVYSNNFHFEISAWDLKILLGQLSQASGKTSIDWHTAVTMPWGAAKLLRYLLSLNIAIYESNSKAIEMPPGSIPETPIPPSGELDTEQNRKFYDHMMKLYRELKGEDKAPSL